MSDPEHKPAKIRAMAGQRSFELNAVDPRPIRTGDRPLPGGQERPCSRCGRMFPPSLKRRMLCAPCFSKASGGDEAA